MKKKIILIAILIVILITTVSVLCGCKGIENVQNNVEIERIEEAGYKVIECNHINSGNPTIYIEMYDPETKVIYGYFVSGRNITIFPILNSDGTPKLYKEGKM